MFLCTHMVWLHLAVGFNWPPSSNFLSCRLHILDMQGIVELCMARYRDSDSLYVGMQVG